METKRVVLITGASSGMGKAIAENLLKENMIVYAAARRLSEMEDLKQRGAFTLAMDITKEEDIVSAVETISENHGGVDILINNAGFGMYGAMEDTAISDARYQFEVNLFGLARLTQLVLPYMRKQKSGTIINISSMGGKMYTPLGSWYHASKHALEGWSDCLRLELKEFNINVVIIEPGIIDTAFGTIMTAPMLKRSGNSAYASLARRLASATEKSYRKENASPAKVIADVVTKIVHSRKPKTRYIAGKMARLAIFGRKWFGDRLFDKVIMSQTK